MRRKLTAVLAVWTTGCMSWHTQHAPVPESTSSSGREAIRVELRSGGQVLLYDARVVGDSIVGMSAPASQQNRQRVAVATSDVRSVARRQFSVGRTVAAVVAIGVATIIIAGASAGSSSSGSSSNSSCAPSSAQSAAPRPA